MKTQKENTVLNILGKPRTSSSMMCSFRCDRELWEDFGAICSLQDKDKTSVLTDFIENYVESNREKLEAYKQFKK